MAETMELEIFRYRPEQESEPTFQTYEVPFREDWVVLDAINHIKDEIDGTLSYRWSCQMGVCGSCGIMINPVVRQRGGTSRPGVAPIRAQPTESCCLSIR